MERTIRFASLRAPDARDLEGVKGWIRDQQPLCSGESDRLLNGSDFVALVEKHEECWLDQVVERAVAKCFPRDVRSFFILIITDFVNCARASSLRQSNVVSATTQAFVYAASTALMF